jgi:hypothetical protein
MCLQTVTHPDMYALLPAYMYKFTRFFARFLAFLIDTPLLVLSMYQRMYLCMHLHTYQQSFAYTDTFRGKHRHIQNNATAETHPVRCAVSVLRCRILVGKGELAENTIRCPKSTKNRSSPLHWTKVTTSRYSEVKRTDKGR